MNTDASESKSPRELMAIASDIVSTLEPFEQDKRTQIFGAVLCLLSLESAKAAVWSWQQKNGAVR